MAECKFTLNQSRSPEKEGDQFTVSMTPPLPVGCRFTVTIEGREVKPGDRAGELKVVGFGAAGTADFEAQREKAIGNVCITVQCEGPPPCGPTTKCIEIGSPQNVQLRQRKKKEEKEERKRDRDERRKEEREEREQERRHR